MYHSVYYGFYYAVQRAATNITTTVHYHYYED